MIDAAILAAARVLARKAECGCTAEPTTGAEFIPCKWCIEAAEDAIGAYNSASWVRIDDAPEEWRDGAEVLVSLTDKGTCTARYLDPGPWTDGHDGLRRYKPVGWYLSGYNGAVGPVYPTVFRPLPAPPEDV